MYIHLCEFTCMNVFVCFQEYFLTWNMYIDVNVYVHIHMQRGRETERERDRERAREIGIQTKRKNVLGHLYSVRVLPHVEAAAKTSPSVAPRRACWAPSLQAVPGGRRRKSREREEENKKRRATVEEIQRVSQQKATSQNPCPAPDWTRRPVRSPSRIRRVLRGADLRVAAPRTKAQALPSDSPTGPHRARKGPKPESTALGHHTDPPPLLDASKKKRETLSKRPLSRLFSSLFSFLFLSLSRLSLGSLCLLSLLFCLFLSFASRGLRRLGPGGAWRTSQGGCVKDRLTKGKRKEDNWGDLRGHFLKRRFKDSPRSDS